MDEKKEFLYILKENVSIQYIECYHLNHNLDIDDNKLLDIIKNINLSNNDDISKYKIYTLETIGYSIYHSKNLIYHNDTSYYFYENEREYIDIIKPSDILFVIMLNNNKCEILSDIYFSHLL